MIVPVQIHGRIAGAITFAASESARHYAERDLLLAAAFTERASLAMDHALRYQEADEVARIREHFLSMASHELRTPLAVVGGFATLLLKQFQSDEPDADQIGLLMRELQLGVERLEALTSDLLVTSSFRSMDRGVQFERGDLVELVQHVIQRFDVAVGEQGKHRIHLDAPDELFGDWNLDLLERALSNLISNAVKYSPDGGDIVVTVSVLGGLDATISVADSGMGMSEEDLERLFIPFSRGSEARKVSDGTGLGLYITRQIVEQHGGSISVESTQGIGSTFTIKLPLRQEGSDD